jgi:hypothetical protein
MRKIAFVNTICRILAFISSPTLTLKRKMGVFVELALSEVFDFGFVWW